MRPVACLTAISLAAVLLIGCGAASSSGSGASASPVGTATPTASPASVPSLTVAATPSCPLSDSGTCLGTLAAGSYSSSSFHPLLTYRVPAGWSNFLDIPGLYLLMPPGAPPPGNTITSDFIGVQTSVAAQATVTAGNPCSLDPAPGVGTTPQAIADWLTRQPGLRVTARHAVTLGNLTGIALDVRMAPDWTKGCVTSGVADPVVPLFVGVAPSQFDHEIAPGYAERDYLLLYRGGTLLVNLIDGSGGPHLAAYAAVAATFTFGK